MVSQKKERKETCDTETFGQLKIDLNLVSLLLLLFEIFELISSHLVNVSKMN